MSPCGVCHVVISDGNELCTGVCGVVFHVTCIKTDGDGVATRSSKNWKCKEWRLSSTSSKASAVTKALTKDFLVRVLEDFKKEVFNELKNMRSEMGEMTTSMQFLSDKVDALNVLMNDIKEELACIKKKMLNCG